MDTQAFSNRYSQVRNSARRLFVVLERFRERRHLLSSVKDLRERFEKYAAFVIILNTLAIPLEKLSRHNFASPRLVPLEALIKVSAPWLDKAVYGIDSFSVLLIVAGFLIARYWLRDETRFWVYAFGRSEIRAFASWLAGNPNEPSVERIVPIVRAAKDADAQMLSKLNFEAYRHSSFELKEEKLFKRNAGFIRKNDRVFMLFYDGNDRDEVIGFSCFLPLTESCAEAYLDGGYTDRGITRDLICAPGEKPGIIVLFATALVPDFKIARGGKTGSYGRYLARCLEYHLEQLFPESLSTNCEFPPIYVQAEKSETAKVYGQIGFRKTEKVSADGFSFLCFERPFEGRTSSSGPERTRFDGQRES